MTGTELLFLASKRRALFILASSGEDVGEGDELETVGGARAEVILCLVSTSAGV